MKTQNEKLQELVKRIVRSSKRNLEASESTATDHMKSLYKGYGDAYALTAGWIQDIIDNDDEN